MEISLWLGQNWFGLVQTAGIIGSLLFTAFTLRKDEKARTISNLLAFKQEHREIWSELYTRPELARILDEHPDLAQRPTSHQEALFVKLLVVHLDAVFRASKADMFTSMDHFRNDVKGFFSLPIPKAVWERLKPLQDPDFATFVERA